MDRSIKRTIRHAGSMPLGTQRPTLKERCDKGCFVKSGTVILRCDRGTWVEAAPADPDDP